MSATTIGLVFDRINSVVAAQGFVRSTDPFSFDRQPAANLDATFYVHTERDGGNGYLGGAQCEEHQVEVWMARKVYRDANGAHRQLKADMDLIEGVVIDDWAAFWYDVQDDSVDSDCRLPQPEASYVVGRLGMMVEFDREP